MRALRYLSVCSGIEAASVAWHPFGWSPVAFAEIERFPSEVLAARFGSNMPGEAWSGNAPPNYGDMTKFKEWPDHAIDLLVGGTPCQSFSVAGLRKGLADPRGNLALVYLAIADRYRPEWICWENVPGVLSSDEGRDFGAFLGGLGELGYGFAYRVLDAQYVRVDGFGRAVPQRRRRVFVVGHSDWRRAAAVLFDGAGLRGDPAPRREAREGIAKAPSYGISPDCFDRSGEPSSGLAADRNGLGIETELAYSLRAKRPSGVAYQVYHDVAHCLNAGGMGRIDYETESFVVNEALCAPAVASWAVRRLMPIEAERLQGFPDGWTAIERNGKPAADGPRYKALGNSMAVNVMRWIGHRIDMVRAIKESA